MPVELVARHQRVHDETRFHQRPKRWCAPQQKSPTSSHRRLRTQRSQRLHLDLLSEALLRVERLIDEARPALEVAFRNCRRECRGRLGESRALLREPTTRNAHREGLHDHS